MALLELDHFALSCTVLDQGTKHVENALGVQLQTGGKHDLMATHNTLLGLQNSLYFEVIATDPDAPAPARPRWFNLDEFTGRPRMTNWVFRTPDINAALEALPGGFGTPLALQRGDLSWKMAVPENGILPWGGWAPAIIEWEGDLHPCNLLQASPVTSHDITLKHPEADDMARALGPFIPSSTAQFLRSDTPALAVVFDCPNGRVTLV